MCVVFEKKCVMTELFEWDWCFISVTQKYVILDTLYTTSAKRYTHFKKHFIMWYYHVNLNCSLGSRGAA